jgi:hypothetical protein
MHPAIQYPTRILHQSLLLLALFWVLASEIQAQLYPVRLNGKWGLINGNGKLIAPTEFDAVSPELGGFSLVVKHGAFGLIDPQGQLIIPTEYTFIQRINSRLWALNQGGDSNKGKCEGGKWGLAYLPTKKIIPPQFNFIQDFAGTEFACANIDGICDYKDCKGGKWAMVDTAANILLTPEYNKIQPHNRMWALIQGANGWGLYDLQRKKQTIPGQFESLVFITPTLLCGLQNKVATLLNVQGDVLIQGRHEEYKSAGQGLLSHRTGTRWGLIDSTGNEIIAPGYDRVTAEKHRWVLLWKEGNLGLARRNGKICTGTNFNGWNEIGSTYARVSQGLAWGLIDTMGKEIIPVRYERIDIVSDSMFVVQDRKIMRWIGLDGKVTRGIAFDEFGEFDQGKAKVTVAKKLGLISEEGVWIVPPKYDELHAQEFVAQARVTNGQWEFFYFDEHGRPSKVKRIVLIRENEVQEDGNANDDFSNFSGATAGFGWFVNGDRLWGLRAEKGNRLLIAPKYRSAVVIPNTQLTLVEGKIGSSEDFGYGIVNHITGKETIAPMFVAIFTEDFRRMSVARAKYAGSGKYTLIRKNGTNVALEGATYIRAFSEGMAAVSVGGVVTTSDVPRFDTIRQYQIEKPNTHERIMQYEHIQGGKWGYVDSAGRWAQAATFEQALPFSRQQARVKISGKWGVINMGFAEVVKPTYDFIEPLASTEDQVLYTVGSDKARFGFIDTLGNVVVVPQFAEAGTYHEGLARVRIDGLWGYADMAGNMVVPPSFKEACDFSEGRARVRNGRKWGYIDSQGNTITPENFLRAGDFHEGRAFVQVGGAFGYIDQTGQLVLPAEFTKAADFSQGVAVVQQHNAMGLIDRQGKFVIQPKYYRIQPFKDSLAVIQMGGSFGIARPDGRIVVKPQYKAVREFSEGLAAYKNGNEFGYMDTAGVTVIAPKFANAGPFSCGRAPVFVSGKWGYIDNAGLIVVEPKYSAAGQFKEDMAAVRVGKKWGFIDRNGELVVPAVYDNTGVFENGRAAVNIAGHGWGFVNSDGTRVVACYYDKVGKFGNGIAPVCLNRKWGVLNKFGSLVTLMKYDEMANYENGLAKVLINRRVGVVSSKGNVVVSPDFDSIKMQADLIQTETNDKLGYLNASGQWVWEPSK